MNTNWREGYDYPSDDDDVVEYDIMEEADRAYEYQNDKWNGTRHSNTWDFWELDSPWKGDSVRTMHQLRGDGVGRVGTG